MKASAGSYESSDCIISLSKARTQNIVIESIVFEQFGDQIKQVIKAELDKHDINQIKVLCQDKGALDYTIRARLITALKRGGYIE